MVLALAQALAQEVIGTTHEQEGFDGQAAINTGGRQTGLAEASDYQRRVNEKTDLDIPEILHTQIKITCARHKLNW
jgi:hypothetical protein